MSIYNTFGRYSGLQMMFSLILECDKDLLAPRFLLSRAGGFLIHKDRLLAFESSFSCDAWVPGLRSPISHLTTAELLEATLPSTNLKLMLHFLKIVFSNAIKL